MSELPPELLAKPLALIGLTGLDLSNTTHRSIWDAFQSNRRPDNLSVHFKYLPLNHTFPTPKPKRNSYEWYIPKGILKRNWMPKYLSEIPAVVVCFYELDWTDSNWTEKKMECASRVQAIRSALDGRSTRTAVVLIQKTPPPTPDAEDNIATERATALCTACELPAKSLYILPHGDHLQGYTSRLESAFYDLAQNFYHHHHRTVKSHKDQLTKTSHQYLFVRHQFKIAFLNELRQEKLIAVHHYKAAYTNLLEIRMMDTNTFEIKTVGAFINYKICKLQFALNQPREAINQFRAHTDRFRSRTGSEDLIFEHHAFMANQYSTFAELFDDAIRQGLPAVQTQHPGYYYQTAATHAGARQTACNQLCANALQVDPDLLDDEMKMEFYGQRSWRPGKLSAECADAMKEALGVQVLKWREKNVDHSMIIIALLGNAMSQFKMYRCPRMRRLLAVQMAAEYYNCKDYGKVLTLLTHMLWEYRSEKWPLLLTDVLMNAMRAAFLNASVQDYLTLSIEALGLTATFSADERSRIYTNLLGILNRKVPQAHPNLPEEAISEAIEKWGSELNRLEDFVSTIEDTNVATFVQVKGSFTAASFNASGKVRVEVIVKNLFEASVEFSKISVTISGPGMSTEIPVEENSDRGCRFEGEELRRLRCEFPASQVPDGTEIQVSLVSLVLGNEKRRIILKFPGDPGGLDGQGSRGSFEGIRIINITQIRQEETSLRVVITSRSPALLSEWLPVKFDIKSNKEISKFSMEVKQTFQDHTTDSTTELSETMITKETSVVFEVESIAPGEIVERTVYVRSHQVGVRNFLARLEFLGSDLMKRVREETHAVEIVKPFDIGTQFYTRLFEPLTKAFVDEEFVVMPNIECSSPWPLKILGTSVELGKAFREEPGPSRLLDGLTIAEGESATDVICVVPRARSGQPTSTGVYTIRWKRNVEEGVETSTSVTLAPLWVEDAPVGIEAKIPAEGWVRTPMCVSYYLKNRSDYLITLKMTMEASDAFMFAGQKQVDIYLRPQNARKVEWILRPLVAGFVALPTLNLSVPQDEEHKISRGRLAAVLERSLPTHVYIMPKSLTSEELLG
ncbi:trafficking protein particle complex subunit 11 [Diachasma alloeum]|uniref:trafficking protein particle complex subunit 11 n=1 Tax=Diachasma alloeum TaxID=454923 RepID=UPI0007381A70|nr:trafficking protein particle complex subunit 11 [Diachasma alloeum]